MAKVITFSRNFPKTHPRSGEPTYFVEQILNEMGIDYESPEYLQHLLKLNTQNIFIGKLTYEDILDFQNSLVNNVYNKKIHTIRNKNRFKKGDFFSPRVWSKSPYNSPQIIFLPITEVKQVFDVFIAPEVRIFINKNFITSTQQEINLSHNDGLAYSDFLAWFSNNQVFEGQIICWNESVSY